MPFPQWLRVLQSLAGVLSTDPAAAPDATRRALLARTVGLIGCLAGASALGTPETAGASERTGRSKRRKREEEAWLNARNMLAFPLARFELPRTGGQLVQSMLAGWKDVFELRDPQRTIWLEGGRYPAVDSMTVDISGATAKIGKPGDKKKKQPELRPIFPETRRSMAVQNFIFQAAPIYHHKAKVNFYVSGQDVRFDLRQDMTGRPLLLLADAKAGALHFRSTCSDLERLLIAGAKPKAAEHAVKLRDVDIRLDSETPRSVKLDLKVRTLIGGFLPAGLRFRARVDVDDRMNAHIWGLSCDGDEALGPLIVNFIRPGLRKYEGKVRPLLSFPTGAVRLRDLRIRAGETVELAAAFGR